MKWCFECKERSYKEDVCTNCGLVFESKPIDFSPPLQDMEKSAEERNFIAMSQFQQGIRNKSKIKIRETKSPELKRALRKYYYPWEDKRDSKIRKELKRIVGLLNLGKDFYSSCFYHYYKIAKYNKKSKTNLFRGAEKVSIEVVAQGIAFLEIKQQKLPYTLNDFEKINCNKKNIKDYYKRLVNEFNLHIEQTSPLKFIGRIVVALELDPRDEYILITATQTFLENILKIEENFMLLTLFRKPIDKAGAFIYALTSDSYGITQKTICDIVGCNVQTLRKRIKEIKAIVAYFFKHFGINEDDYEETLLYGEYNELVDNVEWMCSIQKGLANCLINPKFKMVIMNDRKPFFSKIS